MEKKIATVLLSIIFLLSLLQKTNGWRPCPELSPVLRLPCRCNVELSESSGQLGAVLMNCDRVVFHGESPPLPFQVPIISYSQRFSGQQVLPTQVFGTLNLPLKKLDFSNNAVRRLPEKTFLGVKDTLEELQLSDNLLGDSLNPIFSSVEFHVLNNLKVLNLSGNRIKSIEEGLLKGCDKLEKFILDRNNLTVVPSTSISGPQELKLLSLKHNKITHLRYDSFSTQKFLEKIDLRYNRIKLIEGATFSGLLKLKSLHLGGNKLSKMNSDVFEGIPTLQELDLSENFITQFPTVTLESIESLKILNLSANMLQKVDFTNFQNIKQLEILDLSKNGITAVPPGTFRELRNLKYLDLSLNSLRTIEDDALEGLENLQTLIIRDNNILLVPGSALGRLAHLSVVNLDFNRIAALSSDILASIRPDDVKHLSLSRNVIRELPAGSFQMFRNLEILDLSSNSLAVISADIFMGLETSLKELKVSQNKITGIGTHPLALTELKSLDLSENSLADIPKNALSGVENLRFLNMSGNTHLSPIPPNLFKPLTKLRVIDLSRCGIKQIPGELFLNTLRLEVIILRNNQIQEINDSTFKDLSNITSIDLSHNNITSIRPSSFVSVMSIKRLILKGNQLNAFKGEIFNTGTGLEELDISDNNLSYLFPSSFRIHPRLKRLVASNNKFNFFPSELISSLQYLEHIDLSANQLKNIEELDFARLPRLRNLLLNDNQLESVSEMAFHNSTQLQVVDLSHNRLDRVGERTFEGLIRLECLNLAGNLLNELPETIFERSKLRMLENINLSENKFEYAPLKALQKQYFFLSSVDLSRNKIKLIPSDDSIMVNIKKLDLSFNPLTEEAVNNILSEPKTVRYLNLAGTNIKKIDSLETPFLQILNVSGNNIEEIDENIFERTTLLEIVDLSNNKISNLEQLSKSWQKLPMLQYLDLSNNSFEMIASEDFKNLDVLQYLSITNLEKCSKIEKNAFKHLPNLEKLCAYNLPLLGYLDIQGILESLPGVENIDIEVKDSVIGTDHIKPAQHPRLKEIGLRGERLQTISSGTLAGLKNHDLVIKIRNTSVSSLPPALLFPVPRSSHITLDITGSKVTALSPQFLSALEDRRSNLKLKGLNTNPIHCDCNARALRRWLPYSHMTELRCFSPNYLEGKYLIEVGDDELVCDPRKIPSSSTTTIATTTSKTAVSSDFGGKRTTQQMYRPSSRIVTRSTTTTPEPLIIWSLEPTAAVPKLKTKSPQIKQTTMSNDDTLIIGIVGGVVAFIAILVIIICIVRLKMSSNNNYHQNPPIMGIPQFPLGPGGMQVYSKNGSVNGANGGAMTPSAIYAIPPCATTMHNYATLPHKGLHLSQSNLSQIGGRPAYSTMGRLSYFPQQQQSSNGQPYVIYSDEKGYR